MPLRWHTEPAGSVKVCSSPMAHLLGGERVEVRPISLPIVRTAICSGYCTASLALNKEAVLNWDRPVSSNPIRQVRSVGADFSRKRSFSTALLLIEVFR